MMLDDSAGLNGPNFTANYFNFSRFANTDMIFPRGFGWHGPVPKIAEREARSVKRRKRFHTFEQRAENRDYERQSQKKQCNCTGCRKNISHHNSNRFGLADVLEELPPFAMRIIKRLLRVPKPFKELFRGIASPI
jgi:hypothetical protein